MSVGEHPLGLAPGSISCSDHPGIQALGADTRLLRHAAVHNCRIKLERLEQTLWLAGFAGRHHAHDDRTNTGSIAQTDLHISKTVSTVRPFKGGATTMLGEDCSLKGQDPCSVFLHMTVFILAWVQFCLVRFGQTPTLKCIPIDIHRDKVATVYLRIHTSSDQRPYKRVFISYCMAMVKACESWWLRRHADMGPGRVC